MEGSAVSNQSPEAPQFLERPLREFLDLLAGSAPTPGGGSASALGAAIGAALVSMVASLTVGSPKYAEAHQQAMELRARADEARGELQELVQRDAEAYDAFSQAAKNASVVSLTSSASGGPDFFSADAPPPPLTADTML